MEIDTRIRPEELDSMDTSIDANAFKDTHDGKRKQPEQLAEPPLPANPNLTTVLERPRDGDSPMRVPEQSARGSQIPRLSQDVLTLYGLQPLVASIARTDIATGEKINKLRKSYENHLKTHCLAGRNKGIKELTPEKRLMYLAGWPDEEFYNQKVAGKDIRQGLPNATLEKLGRAMHMQPGPVRDNNKWEELLGLGIIKPVDAVTDKKRKAVNTVAQPEVQVNGSRADLAKTLDTGDTRPKRVAKRRKYDETTYEGYAEGYVDDEADVFGGDGNSSDDHSRKGSAFKRRKKSSRDFVATSTTATERGTADSGNHTR